MGEGGVGLRGTVLAGLAGARLNGAVVTEALLTEPDITRWETQLIQSLMFSFHGLTIVRALEAFEVMGERWVNWVKINNI